MRYKHLEKANIDVSALAVGTWAIGAAGYGEVNEKDSIDAIRAMIDGGVNLIDTAPAYGLGHSEIVVGKAIQGMDGSKVFIATKCGVSKLSLYGKKHPDHVGLIRDGRFENILYECECSLRRLGTDYIDVLFVHWPDVNTPLEETMEAMNVLKKEGKIRFVGVSNFSEEQILTCEKVSQIDVIQPPYSMVARRDETLMKWAVGRGIGTFTYGSLGAGILTGTFRTPPTFGQGDPRNGFYPFFVEPHFSKVMKVLDVMDKISAETGKPLPQIAINWSTQKDFVSTALCGVRNPQEAAQNCAAFDWTLTDEQIAAIDAAIEANLDFDGATPRR